MLAGVTDIKRGQEIIFAVKLMVPNDERYRINPEIVAGDFKIETWDFSNTWQTSTTAIADLTNLPIVLDSNGSTVLVKLTTTETDHDIVIVTAHDQDGLGANWSDNAWILYPGLGYASTLSDMKGATFDPATDSLEAIRDRGDAAWGGAASDPWSVQLPGSYAAGTAGNIVGTLLDVAVSSRLAASNYTAPDNATISSIKQDTGATIPGMLFDMQGATFDPATDSLEAIRDRGDAAWTGSGGLTAQDVANAVWDEPTANHQTAGTTGKALTDAQSAGDPWATALPGNYAAGTAGSILASRASQASVDALPTATDVRIEMDTNSTKLANLDTTVSSRASQTSVDVLQTSVGTVVTTVSGINTQVDLLVDFAKNKKYLEKVDTTWYLVIRDATDTTDILRKALKKSDGTDIDDITAAAVAQELASSV